ncbi:hypothetical protein [Actinokineospora globicatena]|uniref:hypothetical protein n=1 Tax=Actinokineospora globicatena TaxID=103729 RepID=UPI0020A26432|nr:hypothetical protein [Actinokineospora globicatena]MCP2303090.1 hypothetical protein [Actinokineospora globicatena]GLW79796.1 hypothetical protein Aglo01_42770 [Actinokineospora globicatena]GLW85794.1 hypothetical protein Aglo02_34340 [Actinokineospora globicatena]
MRGRIWFEGNPWPEGHRIATFDWVAGLDSDGALWFDPILITEDYDAERMPEEPADRVREWDSPELWTNYEGCLIEPLDDHGFLAATPGSPFGFTTPEPRTLTLDPLPEGPDARHAFQIQLLGHDTCADHTLTTTRQPDGRHRIDWTARIALSYAGETEYHHAFRAEIHDCVPAHVTYPPTMSPHEAHEHLAAVVDIPHHFTPGTAHARPVLRYTGP